MSDLDRVLGRSVPLRETTTTGDIAPVMTGGGMNGRPKRPGLTKKDDEQKKRRGRLAGVLGSIGESSDEDEYEETTEQQTGVIPKDAEEMEDGRTDPSGINMRKPEFKKANPDSPKDEKEALMSPKAALVAPDVTPDSMTEIDPSEVPGGEGETFKAPDVSVAPPEPGPVPHEIGEPVAGPQPGQDTFTTAMDTLLGKSRKPSAPAPGAPPPPSTMESRPAISPETAAAMFAAPVEGIAGETLLRQNEPMPEPKAGNGKVFESYRRFIG